MRAFQRKGETAPRLPEVASYGAAWVCGLSIVLPGLVPSADDDLLEDNISQRLAFRTVVRIFFNIGDLLHQFRLCTFSENRMPIV